MLAYTDVDLSTDLAASRTWSGRCSKVAATWRSARACARVEGPTRGMREVISRTYNILLRVFLEVGFSDAQCGFKAGRREVIQSLLPLVENDAWFFDTALLYLAQRNKFAIAEVPVTWVEDPDSRVAIASTVCEDLRGIARLRARGRCGPGQCPPAPPSGRRSHPGPAQSPPPWTPVELTCSLPLERITPHVDSAARSIRPGNAPAGR